MSQPLNHGDVFISTADATGCQNYSPLLNLRENKFRGYNHFVGISKVPKHVRER